MRKFVTKWRRIRKPALMAGFLFLSLSLFCAEKVYFVYKAAIGCYDIATDTLSFRDPGLGSLSGSFTRDGDSLWFAPFREGTLAQFDTIKEEYSFQKTENLGQAFFLPPCFLTVSSAFNNGFSWETYTLEKKMRFLSRGKLDLFISHAWGGDPEILLAGADSAENFDSIYALNPVTGKDRRIFQVEKEPGFLKFISRDSFLVVYYSTPVNGRKKNRLWAGEVKKPDFKEISLDLPEDWYFFGPGFYLKNLWIIPAINQEKAIAFFCLDEAFKLQEMLNAPTGIYKIITTKENELYFLGYNYFQGAGDYYLGIFRYPGDGGECFTMRKLP